MPHRARLEEVRLGLVEDQLEARVDLGLGGEVIGELEALVTRHPLREGLWCCLITALYRMGRQADALAAYARVRELLVDELGVDPGPQLRDLEDQVLQQSRVLAAGGERPVLAGPVGNLPALSSSLVGRAADVSAVRDRLRDRRLVTVVGPAGVGKTRLAIEVARGLAPAGGVWLVRLDGVDATASIPRTVAETLHLTGGEQMLVERFTGAETVLVLDNCEHVVDGVAALTSELLDATTDLRVLATSQRRLDLDGETVYQLAPLPIEDSVALFAERAAEIRRQFVLDDRTTAAVEEVCLSLDGLPLAIELAAARVRALSVQDIARRLDDRFALLQDPTSRRPARLRALTAAIGWSYELLFPDEQRGLWALSCFVSGAPLDAAEYVLAALGVPRSSAVDVVGRLADRSLVSVEITTDGAVRYRLLDSIRDFALDRLRESGLADDARAAHAAWLAEAADRCDATVRGEAQPECLAVLRAERANIDTALGWSADHDPRLGVRIAVGFGWAWVVHGDGVAGATRVRSALQAAGSLITPTRTGDGSAPRRLARDVGRQPRAGGRRSLRGARRGRAAGRRPAPRRCPAPPGVPAHPGGPPGTCARTGDDGTHGLPPAGTRLAGGHEPRPRGVRLEHARRHRRRHQCSHRSSRPAHLHRRLLGAGTRRRAARRDRPGQRPSRPGRHLPHPRRRGVRTPRLPRAGRPPPDNPRQGRAAIRPHGRRHQDPAAGDPRRRPQRRPPHRGHGAREPRPAAPGSWPARRRPGPARTDRPVVPSVRRRRRSSAHPMSAGRTLFRHRQRTRRQTARVGARGSSRCWRRGSPGARHGRAGPAGRRPWRHGHGAAASSDPPTT